jgi:hypothetical protein
MVIYSLKFAKSKIGFLPSKTNDKGLRKATFLAVTFANAVPGFIFAPPF